MQDTGDTRESPAIDVCKFLTNEGADIHIYDPKVPHEEIKEHFPKAVTVTDVYEGAKAAHAIVVLTEWDEFKTYDYTKLYASMYRPAFLFDGRNILDHNALTKTGFQVYAVGERGPQEEI
jgi:UDPglucose 6-dehydrogenase